MSAPGKSIAKAKPPKSLLELSAESVIKQCIEQGKSNDIIRMMRANPKGVRALEAATTPRLKEVICVVIVGPDGPTEGTAGFGLEMQGNFSYEFAECYEVFNWCQWDTDPSDMEKACENGVAKTTTSAPGGVAPGGPSGGGGVEP